MRRTEYTELVESHLRRLTPKERKAVCEELDAHIEDHICDLVELGYTTELAEERTMLRMGDPDEVGRQINQQYPFCWLVIGRVSMILTLVLLLVMAKPLWELGGQVKDNLTARFAPIHELDLRHIYFGDGADSPIEAGPIVEAAEEINLRRTVDGVTMHLYQAGLEDPTSDCVAWVAGCLYSENPLQNTPNLWGGTISSNMPEVEVFHLGGTDYWLIYAPVRWGENFAFTYEQTGHSFSFCVDLPWKEAEA